MFRTPGFHHVTLVSGNTPRTIRFYQDLLGLPSSRIPAEKCSPSAPTLRFGGEGRPGPLLTFLERPGADRGRPGIGGVHHVALGVPDEAALLKWKRWLNDRGVATSGPINRGYFKSLYFTDPDGQILELATSGPGYAIDEPEGALGQAVIEHHEHLLQRSEGVPYSHRTHPEPVGEISPEMALTGIHHVSAITSDASTRERWVSPG
jgi:glyoxalase family protein